MTIVTDSNRVKKEVERAISPFFEPSLIGFYAISIESKLPVRWALEALEPRPSATASSSNGSLILISFGRQRQVGAHLPRGQSQRRAETHALQVGRRPAGQRGPRHAHRLAHVALRFVLLLTFLSHFLSYSLSFRLVSVVHRVSRLSSAPDRTNPTRPNLT